MYKWTDEQGNVQYTQVPPEDREAEKLKPLAPETPSPAEEQAEDTRQLPPGLMPDGGEGAQELDRQKCFSARQNLEVLMRNREITLSDGKKMVLSEEMRRQKIDEAREEIKRYCGF
jgi:hypothetical protein